MLDLGAYLVFTDVFIARTLDRAMFTVASQTDWRGAGGAVGGEGWESDELLYVLWRAALRNGGRGRRAEQLCVRFPIHDYITVHSLILVRTTSCLLFVALVCLLFCTAVGACLQWWCACMLQTRTA